MRHVAETLDELGVPYEKEVVSAHRTPDKLFAYAESAESRGLQVIIAGAGGSCASSRHDVVEDSSPRARRSGRGRRRCRGSIRSSPSRRCRRVCRWERSRSGGRGQRGAARGRDRRARRRGRGAARRVSRESDRSRARRARSVGVTALVGCIGGGQLGRMLALAGAPLDVRFRFLDPPPTRARETSASSSSGRTTTRCSSTVSPRAPTPSPTSSRTSRWRRRGEWRRFPMRARSSRARIASSRRSSFAASGFPLPATARSTRRASRRSSSRGASATTEKGSARRVAGGLGEDELAEELVPSMRELSIVAVRGRRRRHALLPARRERAPRRDPRSLARSCADAPQGRAEEIATKLLDELGYVGVLAVELFESMGSCSRTSSRRASTTRVTGRSTAL